MRTRIQKVGPGCAAWIVNPIEKGVFTVNRLRPCSIKSMRRWVYLGSCLFVVATQAGQLPLTVSELSLMLRSGYSSNSVRQELAQRHFVDTVDAAKETALLNAGASP